MKSQPIDVLLATCDAGQYLPALLDSLLAQTHQNWRLLVSDDGSVDGTLQVLENYRPLFNERLIVLRSFSTRLGPMRNFEKLMQASQRDGVATCIAFCDQDDVWLPSKLDFLDQGMQGLQAQASPDEPLLVHCDLAVVDAQLKTLHPSFMQHQHYDPGRCTATSMLSINQVTGCAMMVNRALLDLALPLPPEALMHDWWCALLAGSGKRVFVEQALVLYRQHGKNQLGAKGRGLPVRIKRLLTDAPGVFHRVRQLGRGTKAQADALARRLAERRLDNAYVHRYLAWREFSWWRRVSSYRSHYIGPELDRCSRLLLW